MNTRPSKRPSVKQVSKWYTMYENERDQDWRGHYIYAKVENGYPFPDFYRVTYKINDQKSSKIFFGETAWSKTEMFVYDLGFRDILGRV